MGYKAKQIDLPDLSIKLSDLLNSDLFLLQAWQGLTNCIPERQLFRTVDTTLTTGQTELLFETNRPPVYLMIFRNGLKILEGPDYSYNCISGVVTVTLTNPISASPEVVEINNFK